jgi:Pentapeptide repeats (8 copies)
MAQVSVSHKLRGVGRAGRVAILTPVLALVIVGPFIGVWLLAPSRYRLAVEGILVLLIILLLCVLVFPKLIAPARSDDSLKRITKKERIQFQDDRLKLQNDVRAALLQALGGAALLAGLFFTWQQFQTNREQLDTNRKQLSDQLDLTRRQLDLTHRGQVADRFTRAVDQLGSGKLEKQIGGIYGLDQITHDFPDQRLVVFEVLTAYVREHAPWPPRLPGQPAKDAPIKQVPELQLRAPDVHAALRVLSRYEGRTRFVPYDLHSTDLRNLTFIGGNLEYSNFSGANLQGAALYSGFMLRRNNFIGANLQGADLQGAYLSGANLEGAKLRDAQLQHADLDGASFHGADLSRAHLENAILVNARFGGANADPRYANLEANLQGATANKYTQWPYDRYPWRKAGVKMLPG